MWKKISTFLGVFVGLISVAGVPDDLKIWWGWLSTLVDLLGYWPFRTFLYFLSVGMLTYPQWLPKLRTRISDRLYAYGWWKAGRELKREDQKKARRERKEEAAQKKKFEDLHGHLKSTRDLVSRALDHNEEISYRLRSELVARRIFLTEEVGISCPDLPKNREGLARWAEFLSTITEYSSKGRLRVAQDAAQSYCQSIQ